MINLDANYKEVHFKEAQQLFCPLSKKIEKLSKIEAFIEILKEIVFFLPKNYERKCFIENFNKKIDLITSTESMQTADPSDSNFNIHFYEKKIKQLHAMYAVHSLISDYYGHDSQSSMGVSIQRQINENQSVVNKYINTTESKKIIVQIKNDNSNITIDNNIPLDKKVETQEITSTNNSFTATSATTVACIAAYAATVLAAYVSDQSLINHGNFDLSKVLKGQVWRLATHTILHLNAIHLLMNMFALHSLGPTVEQRWGAKGFFKIAAMATASDVLAKIVLKDNDLSVGISGVIFGLAGALHVIKTPKNTSQLDLNSSLKMWVLNGVVGNVLGGSMYIDHVAHVTGYIAGLAFGWLSNKAYKPNLIQSA